MKPPAWRVWLVTALACAWGILTVRAVQQGDTPFILLCGLMFLYECVTLWRLTKRRE